MKFRSSHRLPPHQDRRLQMRMLGFVGAIALIIFAWQVWQIGNETREPGRTAKVDFTVEEEDRPSQLKHDEIRIVPHRPRLAAVDRGEGQSDIVELDPAWLATVDDNTVGIRHEEADAFYHILAQAARIPVSELRAAAEPHVFFANLMNAPEKFRGRPITIVGEMRRLRQIPVPENVARLDQLYEAWICTSDSGENPYRVVSSEIPAGLKPQESSRTLVKTTGYFFKREGYQTQDLRLHVAPTLLAGKLELYAAPESAPVEDMVPWLIGIISVVGLAMLATVIGFAVSDSRRHRLATTQESIDAAALLQADRRETIEESLRRLEESSFEDEPPRDDSYRGNGASHHDDEPQDEVVDLPTPFPPTRVPPRWDDGT